MPKLSVLQLMLRRLQTQQQCLEYAIQLIEGVSGCIMELGLGKGRTYDHLRCIAPQRSIFVFDHHLHAPENARPLPSQLILGDFTKTLIEPAITLPVALIHADIGTTKPLQDRQLYSFLATKLDTWATAHSVLVCDRPMPALRWQPLQLPPACEWPYYMYRKILN